MVCPNGARSGLASRDEDYRLPMVSAPQHHRVSQVPAALTAALRGAVDGSGRLVLVTGEPGIGKTTTARELSDQARRSGVAVRWAASWAGGATVAHAPWLAVLAGLGDAGAPAIEALLGSEATDAAAATSARASAYAQVVSVLGEAASARPLLLVLDDLHWADEGTVQLLGAVAGQLPGMGVLVVGTYRDTDVLPGAPLTRVGGSTERLALRPLDLERTREVLVDSLGAEPAADVAGDVLQRTGGNPFLVVQLGRLLASDPTALERDHVPEGARDLLGERLAALSPADREVLLAAAVLGSPFHPADLGALLDEPPDVVIGALDRAATVRIIERVAGVQAWAFVHDLFGQAAVGLADEVDVARLHGAAATILIEGDAEPSVIANHLFAASGGRSPEAATWSVRAGDRAIAAMAWEEAVAHYERALQGLAPGDESGDGVRADALLGLGRSRLLAGDAAGAGRAFDEVSGLARRSGSATLLARAALGYSVDLSGFEVRLFDQRQIDLLEEAAEALDGTGVEADALRATVMGRLSVALSLTASHERRLDLAEVAVNLARAADDPMALGHALAAHCDAISSPDHVLDRLAESSEIIAIGERAGDAPLELLGRRLRFVACLESGDMAGADREAAGFERRADALGNPLYSWYVPLWRAQRMLIQGDLEGCEQGIAEADQTGRAAGSTNAPMLAVVLQLGLMWQRGDYDGAVDAAGALTEVAPEIARYISSVGAFARVYAMAGRPTEGSAFLDRAMAEGLDALAFDAEWLACITTMVDAAALLGHPILPAALEALLPHADLVSFEGIGAGLYGCSARFAARGCSALGRHDEALTHARRALEVNRRIGGSLVADALRTLGDCLEKRDAPGDAVEAETCHAQADAIYTGLDLSHFARSDPSTAPSAAPSPPPVGLQHVLRRDGDVWHVTFAGSTTIVKHTKGMSDLAVLLAAPGREVHVSELEGVQPEALGGSGGDALDRRAIRAYRDRLAELAEEIDDADADHDLGRAERSRLEYDALVEQLSGSMGIGGRSRPAGAEPIERLRKAVSARIRDAIRRLDTVQPPLGRHLTVAVRTGTYCSYRPEQTVVWRCQTRSGAPGA